MRWKLEVKAETKEYSERIITRYALFPKSLDDNYRVWLEHYYIKQVYYIYSRKGEWRDRETWSESTEQRKFLNSIKDSENVQDRMDSPTYTLAKQAAARILERKIAYISDELEKASDLIFHTVSLTDNWEGATVMVDSKEDVDDTLYLTYYEQPKWTTLDDID